MPLFEYLIAGTNFGYFIYSFLYLLFFILMLVTYEKLYVKAGIKGWWAYVPFLNIFGMVKIATGGKNTFPMFILLFVPAVNIIVILYLLNRFCLAFGKNACYMLGIIFLPFIFLPVLAFGNSKYEYYIEG